MQVVGGGRLESGTKGTSTVPSVETSTPGGASPGGVASLATSGAAPSGVAASPPRSVDASGEGTVGALPQAQSARITEPRRGRAMEAAIAGVCGAVVNTFPTVLSSAP